MAMLIHLSFVASLFCAFIVMLAGIEEALHDRVSEHNPVESRSHCRLFTFRYPVLLLQDCYNTSSQQPFHGFFVKHCLLCSLVLSLNIVASFSSFSSLAGVNANIMSTRVRLLLYVSGLPAISTAISLGVLHEDYGTTTQ